MGSVALRRIALVAVLGLLFVAFYNYFAAEMGRAHKPDVAGDLPWKWALVALILVSFLVAKVLVGRSSRVNGEGLVLLQQGRAMEALTRFEQARRSLLSVVIAFNLGRTQLTLWRLDEAVAELGKVWRSRRVDLKRLVAAKLALATALQGEADAARGWLASVRAQHNEGLPEALLATAVLACRAQQWPQAQAVLERNELRTLGGTERGIRDALRAWTFQLVGGPQLPVDREAVLGEAGLQQVRQVWPEFAAFLESAPPA